jgi:signal peptidase I
VHIAAPHVTFFGGNLEDEQYDLNPRPGGKSPSEIPTQPIMQEPQEEQRPWWKSVGRFLLETFQTVILALVLYLLIDSVVARVRVENISMRPTLAPGEFILVNKLAYRLGDMSRGDIIVFHYPQNPAEDYIKRIIGLPGDDVKVQGGKVTVNGLTLNEPYISAPPNYLGDWKIPDGQIFVLGDNRNQSSDSHSWGTVPLPLIVGRAIFIYWPIDRVQVLSHPSIVNAASP